MMDDEETARRLAICDLLTAEAQRLGLYDDDDDFVSFAWDPRGLPSKAQLDAIICGRNR